MISYYLRLLGDEKRGKIVMLLMNSPLCAQELSSIIGIEQTNLSKHLKKLCDSQIITFIQIGKYKYYNINEEILHTHDYINAILRAYQQECINSNGHFKIFDVIDQQTIKERKLLFESSC